MVGSLLVGVFSASFDVVDNYRNFGFGSVKRLVRCAQVLVGVPAYRYLRGGFLWFPFELRQVSFVIVRGAPELAWLVPLSPPSARRIIEIPVIHQDCGWEALR